MVANAEEVQKQVKVYLIVFAALMVLTVVTVGVSYLDLPTPTAIALGMFVALVKGSLVACYFMHLISEKKVIYLVMGITGFFFAMLMVMPSLVTFTSLHE